MSHLSCVLTCLVALCPVAGSASAQEKQYALSNFDITVHVRPDGHYEVEESITYDFQRGTFSRAYRSVVEAGRGLRNVQVTSPDALVDSVRMGEENGTPQIRWAFPDRSAPTQFDVRYVLDDAIHERGARNAVKLDVMANEAVVATRVARTAARRDGASPTVRPRPPDGRGAAAKSECTGVPRGPV